MTNQFTAAIAETASTTDQSTASTGGNFERTVAPAGFTTARFVGYVEIGKQPQRAYEGQEKPDAPEVRLTFELNGPKQITEYEKDGETHKRSNLQREKITISQSDKSNFFKLFTKMAYGRSDIKHMAQMLGEGFLIKISHNTSKDGKKTYANMKSKENGWEIGAPSTTDPVTNDVTMLNVPEATVALQCLLWDNPTQEMWDSIFIDGSYEKDGVSVSKNFIQNEALDASNFGGSALEALIGGMEDLTITPEKSSAPSAVEKAIPTSNAKSPSEPEAGADPLADLGLA
mgnify:CR=1 FL=1